MMGTRHSWTSKLLKVVLSAAAVLPFITTSASASSVFIDANPYKAFHDTYDESDPDRKFRDALDMKFYNVELDIMVDTNRTRYEGPQYPDYLQGKVKLYVKHDAAAWPNTRHLYQYFEDMAAQIAARGGSIHGDGRSIIVNLDMKTANSPNYEDVADSLQAIFTHYESYMSHGYIGSANSFTERAITVCLSGADALKNAYFNYISGRTGKLLAFKDEVYSITHSRYGNVADYFPNAADIYHRFYAVHWKHIESGFDTLMPGNWSQEEEQRLKDMMYMAEQKGYTLRFYSLNGNEGAWHYKFPNGDGDAAQRWTQFAYMNHKLGTRHFVSTDSYQSITKLFNHFLVPLRDYNHRVEKPGGTQNGVDVSVSITDDRRVVEVHKAEGLFNNNLWYFVGSVRDDGYIQWVTNERINPGGQNKNGVQPHSDVTNVGGQQIVVQVNKTDGTGSGLWANIGRLEPNSTITWITNERIAIGGSHTSGDWPHIAIDGDRAVLVYLNGGKLHYHTGRINTSNYSITWSNSGTINNQNGERPDVAFQDGRIVVVYRDGGRLNYTTGTWGQNGNLTWNASGSMGDQDGKDPAVAFIGTDKIIELHTSQNTGLIWYNIGELEWPNIRWIHNYVWDSGVSSRPSVDYNAATNLLVDLHKSGMNDALWYNTGSIHFP